MRYVRKDRNFTKELCFELITGEISTEFLPFYYSSNDDGIYELPSYSSLQNPNKNNLKSFLIREQNGLCAYCQQELSLDNSTIEHIICQQQSEYYSLTYHNLLAVCNGNFGAINTQMHCDKFRALENKYGLPLWFFNDCETTDWDSLNKYLDIKCIGKIPTGEFSARKEHQPLFRQNEITYLIEEVLNLNAPKLVEARRLTYEVNVEVNLEGFSQQDWKRLFDYYLGCKSEPFNEFLLLAIRKQVL